jgi:hypothetical protein
MVEVVVIVGAIAAQRDSERKRLAQPSSPSYALLIVKALWRHVRHHYRLQRANIDPNLHRRRDA